MECSKLIEDALKNGDISTSLYQGSTNKELITDLQRILFELGFSKELKWDKYQADGDYGKATSSAVASFADKNKYTSNGTKVTKRMAKLILQRHDFLPDMYVLWSIYKSDFRTKKYFSKGSPMSISAIQVFLNELGYEDQLKFSKSGADGLYGDNTRNAVIAYANDNGIQSDGDLLTRPLVNLLIKHINQFYGKNWSDLASNNLPGGGSPLVLYQGSRFRGTPCRSDKKFVPMLEKINAYAEQAEVFIYVTSSFRTTTNVQGAIVQPTSRSNHLAGHAIDMNIVYNNGRHADSEYLAKYPSVALPVKSFIKSIIDDPILRWGGAFRVKDVVHIDDHLNGDASAWDKRYKAMQGAVQLGK